MTQWQILSLNGNVQSHVLEADTVQIQDDGKIAVFSAEDKGNVAVVVLEPLMVIKKIAH